MLSGGPTKAYADLKITVFNHSPAGYDDPTAEERSYMEHPYEVTRQDERGKVSRGFFRYLGDASVYVRAILAQETNPCLWRVRNLETNRLCCRWRYENGQATHEIDNLDCDDE